MPEPRTSVDVVVAVADEMKLRGRRGDPFVEHGAAEERVDERALAGVELADDDEEEELVELADGFGEGRRVRGCGRHGRQLDLQVDQQAACGRQLLVGLLAQHPVGQRAPRSAVTGLRVPL